MRAETAWEQQRDESVKAYRAFCVYRDLGPERSLDRVAEILYPTKEGQKGRKRAATGRLQEWSSRHRWVERARAHDAEAAHIDREAWEQEQREMAKKRVRVSHRMLDLVAARLDSMSPEDVPLSYVAKWAEASAKLGTPIGDDASESRNERQADAEHIELVIRDPEARRLALELDERMGELDSRVQAARP